MDKIIYDKNKKKNVGIIYEMMQYNGPWDLISLTLSHLWTKQHSIVYRESKTFIQTCLNLWDTSFCFPQGCHFFPNYHITLFPFFITHFFYFMSKTFFLEIIISLYNSNFNSEFFSPYYLINLQNVSKIILN